MNIRRTALFSLVLIFVQVLTDATVTYLVSKSFDGDQQQMVEWIVAAGHFSDLAVVIPIFIWLGRKQQSRPYLHAVVALTLSQVVQFAVLYFLTGSVAIHASHAVGVLVLLAYAIVGTTIGLSFAVKSEEVSEPPSPAPE